MRELQTMTDLIANLKAIASDAKEEFYRGVFVLQPGDQVKVQTSGSGDVEFSITFNLMEAPATFVNFS